MNSLIFHVTDGPSYAPNGVYKAHVLRAADAQGFFVVQSVRGGDTNIVSEANIRLLAEDNRYDEGRANSRGAATLPRAERGQPATVLSRGVGSESTCGAMRVPSLADANRPANPS